MHGEAEAKLVLGDFFSIKEEQGTATTENLRMDVEESWLDLQLRFCDLKFDELFKHLIRV